MNGMKRKKKYISNVIAISKRLKIFMLMKGKFGTLGYE